MGRDPRYTAATRRATHAPGNPDSAALPPASDTSSSRPEQSIPRLFHALWRVRPGRAARERHGRERDVRARVLAYVGPPDVFVVQVTAREWSIRITAPACWEQHVLAAGLAVVPDPRTGKPGLVLDWKEFQDLGGNRWRQCWVLRRPHDQRNRWVVVLEPHPVREAPTP